MTNPPFDLEAAAASLETVVAGVPDDRLDDPTPNDGRTVRGLIAHIATTEAFRQGAAKEGLGTSQPPAAEPELPADWRTRIPAQLKSLVAAWREPDAWVGDTEVGGARMPAPGIAAFGLDELVVHGWDLAVATGQDYATPSTADLEVLTGLLADNPPEGVPGLFGPVVTVAPEASAFDRILGLTGRDPSWKPSR